MLRDIEWRIAPGERTGILGVNGAGKSTLLGLIAGTVTPTSGRVKRGKTVKIATLTQLLGDLDDILDERVSAVIAGKRTTYLAGGKEMTPGQMLERLGFTSAQLSTPVKDLSGGQKRRLQLLLILLDEPNVLILDEPTNDLDTDMLAAMEDLLDSWPGTLIVVSHDRYLIERITDNQYAVMDAALRHLPGGVDQYLALRRSESAARQPPRRLQPTATSRAASSASPALAGAELRNAQKEVASIDRRAGEARRPGRAHPRAARRARPERLRGPRGHHRRAAQDSRTRSPTSRRAGWNCPSNWSIRTADDGHPRGHEPGSATRRRRRVRHQHRPRRGRPAVRRRLGRRRAGAGRPLVGTEEFQHDAERANPASPASSHSTATATGSTRSNTTRRTTGSSPRPLRHGAHTAAWAEPRPGANVARAATFMLFAQIEPGHACPISMTHAAVPALAANPRARRASGCRGC